MTDAAPRHIVAASALIRNARGEIALVRTARRGWELPGGQIELGESLIDGLQREVLEECGIQIEVERLLHVRSNLSSGVVIFCFRASYLSGQLRPSEETPEVRWADADSAQELISHPALLLSLREMLKDDTARTRYDAYRTDPFAQVESRGI